MYAQPRPCRGGRATSRERGGIGIAAGGKGEPPPPPPYTISDDDRGSPQTPGAGSAVGLGRRSVGLEPHESPTTPLIDVMAALAAGRCTLRRSEERAEHLRTGSGQMM